MRTRTARTAIETQRIRRIRRATNPLRFVGAKQLLTAIESASRSGQLLRPYYVAIVDIAAIVVNIAIRRTS